MIQKYLSETPILDYRNEATQLLISERSWAHLNTFDKIGAVYSFVRDDILFGYNADDTLPASLQTEFRGRKSLCAYGAGTDDLAGIDAPAAFCAVHRQLKGVRGIIYRHVIRHWMNRRVAMIRAGHVPAVPDGAKNLWPQASTQALRKGAS